MNSRHSAVPRLLLMIALVLTLPGTARAAPQAVPELYVFPLEGAPGATLHLSGFNLAGGDYVIQIWDWATAVTLGTFAASRDGTLSGTAVLPDLAPGAFTLIFQNPDIGATAPFHRPSGPHPAVGHLQRPA